jgi:hypothetical protein
MDACPENSQESPSQEPENSQENPGQEPENSQERPSQETVSGQESPLQEPENSQESPAQELPKKGRPRKSEEEKKETRRQKYQRAKERRQVRVVEEPPCPPPTPEFREPLPDYERPQMSAMELLQRALSESKEAERQRKESVYDSWFQRLKRNNARYQR